jgi:hypothetical protein
MINNSVVKDQLRYEKRKEMWSPVFYMGSNKDQLSYEKGEKPK